MKRRRMLPFSSNIRSDDALFPQNAFLCPLPCRFVMACVALLNFSNTALWICVASVSNYADTYYNMNVSAILYFSAAITM